MCTLANLSHITYCIDILFYLQMSVLKKMITSVMCSAQLLYSKALLGTLMQIKSMWRLKVMQVKL